MPMLNRYGQCGRNASGAKQGPHHESSGLDPDPCVTVLSLVSYSIGNIALPTGRLLELSAFRSDRQGVSV